jgi:hypothetical protein
MALPKLEIGPGRFREAFPKPEIGLESVLVAFPKLEIGLGRFREAFPKLEIGLESVLAALPKLEIGLGRFREAFPKLAKKFKDFEGFCCFFYKLSGSLNQINRECFSSIASKPD